MTVWVAELIGYDNFQFRLFNKKSRALAAALVMMRKSHGKGSKFLVIEEYADQEGITAVVRQRDAEEFFPGEDTVKVYEKKIE